MDKCLIDYPSQRKRWPLVLIFFLAKFVITTPIYMTYIRYKLHTHTRKKMTSHWKSIWLAFTFYYIWKKCHVLTLFGFSFVVINADKWRCYFFVCVSHLFFFLSKGWFICTTMTIEKEWMSSSGLVFFWLFIHSI